MSQRYCLSIDEHGGNLDLAGFVLTGVTYYVFTSAQTDAVPIYRFLTPIVFDPVFTRDSNSDSLIQQGYMSQGVAFYLLTDSRPGTIPLYGWSKLYDHYYTTDSGDYSVAGYSSEGVLGHFYTDQQPGTVALKQWVNAPSYELHETTLKTWCYDRNTEQMRESRLSLDNALEVMGGPKLVPTEAPDDKHNPANDGRDNLGVAYADGKILLLELNEGPVVRMRTEDAFSTYDRECDLRPYLRRSTDGRIEFVHPTRDTSWDWFTTVASNYQAAQRSPGEAIVELTIELLESEGIRGALAEYMVGTYWEDGKLIRRGS